MTIKEKKKELDKKILELIQEFEKETGLQLTDVTTVSRSTLIDCATTYVKTRFVI